MFALRLIYQNFFSGGLRDVEVIICFKYRKNPSERLSVVIFKLNCPTLIINYLLIFAILSHILTNITIIFPKILI